MRGVQLYTKEVWTSRSVLRRETPGRLSAARLTDIVGAILCAMCGCGPGEGPAGLTNDMLWARMLCAVYTLYSEELSVRLRISAGVPRGLSSYPSRNDK